MNLLSKVRHMGTAAAVTATAALVIGCGGGGGGGSSTNGGAVGNQAIQTIKNNGTFVGTISDTAVTAANRGQAAPATTVSINFNDTSGGAAFKTGTFGSTEFRTYTADISNIVITPTAEGDSGTVSFDMTNFTTGAPYQSLHWAGNYQWNEVQGTGAVLTISGSITGTDINNGAVNKSFSVSYKFFSAIVPFTGNWQGDISIPTVGTENWTGAFNKVDDTHTTVHITYGDKTITVPAVTTNIALAGEFDGSAFLAGAAGQFYMERDPAFNDDNHLIGGYTVTLGGSVIGNGVIHAVRVTAPAPTLTTNVYKGTFTPNGGTAQELTLDFVSISSNVGAHGAALFNPEGKPVFAGRILTVTSGTTSTTVTLSNLGLTQVTPTLAARYSGISFFGMPTANGFSGSYSASLVGGGNESGTFTTTKQPNVARISINGTYSGSAKGNGGAGTANTFSGTISQLDDEFSFTATQKVSGQNVTFTVSGFIVGNTFVGNAVSQPITVSGISGTYTGHFEGDVSSNGQTITGEFFYTATAAGIGSISDNGTFTLTKQ